MPKVAQEYPFCIEEHNCDYTKERTDAIHREKVISMPMHKSNLVPVFEDDKQYAKDLVRMRIEMHLILLMLV